MKSESETFEFAPPTEEEKTELARKIEWFKEFTNPKPFFTGYRPQFYFKTTNADGTINLPE